MDSSEMNITVIGCGHVGLSVAAGFAESGHRVVCCELSDERRAAIKSGRAPFSDAGLDNAVSKGVASGALLVCREISDAVSVADVVFLAIQIVSNADIEKVHEIARSVARHAPAKCVLAVKSTVPPGTSDELCVMLKNKLCIAANPEFLRQGEGLDDFLSPSRIVVGVGDSHAAKIMRRVYAPIIENGAKYIQTTRICAEIGKLAANMLLSARVILINEVANLCESAGGDINDVVSILSSDKRIGESYLQPSAGVGGSCLPKDGKMLLSAARKSGAAMPAARSLFVSNKNRPAQIAARITSMLPPSLTVAAWGMSFKPGVDDLSHSAAVLVVQDLITRGVKVNAFDPFLTAATKKKISGVQWMPSGLDAVMGADLLAVFTSCGEFSSISPSQISQCMRGKIVFDCAGVFCPSGIQKAGLTFHQIGGK